MELAVGPIADANLHTWWKMTLSAVIASTDWVAADIQVLPLLNGSSSGRSSG